MFFGKRLVPLSLLCSVSASSLSDELAFKAWVQEHNKTYGTEEKRQKALKNFRDNSKIIEKLNSDPEDEAEYGHGPFSDISAEEFQSTYLPYKMDQGRARLGGAEYKKATVGDLPESVDWRNQGAVTPVKNQGPCGSCWAESAVGNIESRYYLAKKPSGMKAPVSLSVQQVIECDKHDNACYGGYPKGAYEYAIEHGGIDTEADYPYKVNGKTICLANQTFNQTCGDGMCDDPPLTSWCDVTCRQNTKAAASIVSWQALPQDEDQMAANLAKNGPLSVCLDASGAFGALLPWLQMYKRGVANPRFCSKTVDHGVLAVGYGVEKGQKYWLIKNSWGEKWGESGYFRLMRGTKKCGIDTVVTTAVVDAAVESLVI
eukprot:TRINITY_DN3159_c0_g1_i1.p1 TRINITY_DN3159_c0_g1~~TRINITY_DN3159_c0_g1_i1.p1  ORF type:complete len:373 (+),score=98.47 TRINITY_DN3159_c0_g1_i1:77-1195(+)